MRYLSGSVSPSRWESLTDRAQRTALLCVKMVSQHLSPKSKAPPAVVFVVGVQRSGVNMMMDILGRSMQTEVFHECHSRGFQDFDLKSLSTPEASVRGRLRGRPS